jgi:hypothetical protein
MCRTLLFALILNLLFPLYGSAKFIEPYLKENLSEEEKQQELVENIALASTGAFLTILSKQISPKRLVNQYTQAHKQLQFAEAKLRKKIVELRKKGDCESVMKFITAFQESATFKRHTSIVSKLEARGYQIHSTSIDLELGDQHVSIPIRSVPSSDTNRALLKGSLIQRSIQKISANSGNLLLFVGGSLIVLSYKMDVHLNKEKILSDLKDKLGFILSRDGQEEVGKTIDKMLEQRSKALETPATKGEEVNENVNESASPSENNEDEDLFKIDPAFMDPESKK